MFPLKNERAPEYFSEGPSPTGNPQSHMPYLCHSEMLLSTFLTDRGKQKNALAIILGIVSGVRGEMIG